jgi:hypothetical protein
MSFFLCNFSLEANLDGIQLTVGKVPAYFYILFDLTLSQIHGIFL